jgi:hypothetical protein
MRRALSPLLRSLPALVPAWLGTTPLSATARLEQDTEERIEEARASPTPVLAKGNWVIVPIPVANPTIGTGLQLAALYLHAKRPGQEDAPGSTSGLVAVGTDRGTRVFGAFHDDSLDNDRFRLNAFVGSARFNLKFYGVGENSPLAGNPISYEMDGGLAQVRGGVRVAGTDHLYAGLTYQYLHSTLTFKTSEVVPGLPDVPASFDSAALGPQLTWDSRDSNYYPTRGQYARVSWLNYGKRWGGDFEFDKFDTFYNHYLPLAVDSLLALRARHQAASDGTPFFALPTLDMRGFSIDRYRDNHTLSLTAEWRHKFTERWGMVAYAEAGRFASTFKQLSDGRTIKTVGGGIRWRVTQERDMNIGLDYAVSSDDRALFIQIAERF